MKQETPKIYFTESPIAMEFSEFREYKYSDQTFLVIRKIVENTVLIKIYYGDVGTDTHGMEPIATITVDVKEGSNNLDDVIRKVYAWCAEDKPKTGIVVEHVLPIEEIEYPEIYGWKTPERHTIGGSPDVEAVYRKLDQIGKINDRNSRHEAFDKMSILREKFGSDWESHWDEKTT